MKKNTHVRTDTHFIGLKLLSTFSIGCIGSAQMFLPIFYKKVLGLAPFVSFVAFPYWTALVDKTGDYKKIMTRNMLIALVCILFIGTVPFISESDPTRIFLVSLGCFGYAFFGYPVIAALVDAVILQCLGEHQKQLYGRQKIGVPIGFASSVFFTGLLTEKLDSLYALFIVFTCYALAFVVALKWVDIEPVRYTPILDQDQYTIVESPTSEYGSTSNSPPLPQQELAVEDDDNVISTPLDVKVSMWTLLMSPDAVQFFSFAIMLGFAFTAVQAFLYLFFELDLHGTPAMLALLGPIGSITEAVCFFFSKEIHDRLGSRGMLIVGQTLIIIRCLIYMLCTKLESGAWVAVVVQLLHGVGFSVIWSAGALQADKLAPKQLKSSAQGLLNMAFNGIGSGLGAVVGGFVYESYGAWWMWATVSSLAFLSIVFYTSTLARNTIYKRASLLVAKHF